MSNCCEHCDDGEGGCVYPYYGAAPHRCGFKDGNPMIGHSKELPAEEWPENFECDGVPNPGGYPGQGVYRYCLVCGRPDEHQRMLRIAQGVMVEHREVLKRLGDR